MSSCNIAKIAKLNFQYRPTLLVSSPSPKIYITYLMVMSLHTSDHDIKCHDI